MPRDFRCLACGQLTFATDPKCDRCGVPIGKTRLDKEAAYSPWRGRGLSLAAVIGFGCVALLLGLLGPIVFDLGFLAFFVASFIAGHILWFRVRPRASLWYSRGRALRGRTAQEELRRDRRRPIVYLRGFDSDTPPDEEGSSFEEQLARHVRRCGPAVAVGRPGEQYPPLGFSRDYVSDERWKALVSTWLSDAQLVLVSTNFSGDSLAWEIEQCKKMVNPRRVLFLIEGDAFYFLFRHKFNHLFPRPLPEAPAIRRLTEIQQDLFEIIPLWFRQRIVPDTPERLIRFRSWECARLVQVDRHRTLLPHVSGFSRWKAGQRFDNILRAAGVKVRPSMFWTWVALSFLLVQVARFVWSLRW